MFLIFDMAGLTEKQKELYLSLHNAIEKREDITDLLKQAEKDELKRVLLTSGTKQKYVDQCMNVRSKNIGLIVYACNVNNMKALKAISSYCEENGTSVSNVLNTMRNNNDVDLLSSVELVEVEFDERKAWSFFLSYAKGFYHESLSEFKSVKDDFYMMEIADKAMKVGNVCGVIAGLAVGGGLFATGVTFPILAMIGIAVAAAVVTGLVASGITYAMLKPSNELNEVNAQQPGTTPEVVK